MGGNAKEGGEHRPLGTRCGVDIDPETDSHHQKGESQYRHEDPGKAHPVGTEGDHLVISGKTSKNQQDSR